MSEGPFICSVCRKEWTLDQLVKSKCPDHPLTGTVYMKELTPVELRRDDDDNATHRAGEAS